MMNKEEFERMMQNIDAVLSLKGVPFHARPVQAGTHISRSYGIDFIYAPPPLPAIPDRYDELTMSSHVEKWYENRYGDRINLPFDDRRVVILIKNELWCLVLPTIFGRFTAICDPDLEKYMNRPLVTVGGTPQVINVLNCIKDMTSEVGKGLSREEQREILDFFVASLDLIQSIWHIDKRPFIKEAVADLQSSVTHLIGHPPHYGQSKWASLQMVEKFLKSFLSARGAGVPRNHNLISLAEAGALVGMAPLEFKDLREVECAAGVRYGEIPVSRDEALQAHHASLRICRVLKPQIQKA